MKIKLTDVINIHNPRNYKMHLASWNGANQPLDVFVRDKEQWKKWNAYRGEGKKNHFNRNHIFSVIDFYHERDTWLFGGVWEVLERFDNGYKVELTNQFKPMIGRLKFHWKREGRIKSRKLEQLIDKFEVSEILKEEFSGEVFCGYENINHGFSQLENMFALTKKDWKAALENVKGIYLIMDISTGKKYVGAAYGNWGIWSRWSSYMDNGHGGNQELRKFIKRKGAKWKDYARKNFQFSLLEYRSMTTDDEVIRARESHWKDVLRSREHGFNKN